MAVLEHQSQQQQVQHIVNILLLNETSSEKSEEGRGRGGGRGEEVTGLEDSQRESIVVTFGMEQR